MNARWLAGGVLCVLLLTVAVPAGAGQGDHIVTVKSGLNGLNVINTVCNLAGCTVRRSLDTVPGASQPSSLFLVSGLVDTVVTTLLSLLGIAAIEPDLPVTMSGRVAGVPGHRRRAGRSLGPDARDLLRQHGLDLLPAAAGHGHRPPAGHALRPPADRRGHRRRDRHRRRPEPPHAGADLRPGLRLHAQRGGWRRDGRRRGVVAAAATASSG